MWRVVCGEEKGGWVVGEGETGMKRVKENFKCNKKYQAKTTRSSHLTVLGQPPLQADTWESSVEKVERGGDDKSVRACDVVWGV